MALLILFQRSRYLSANRAIIWDMRTAESNSPNTDDCSVPTAVVFFSGARRPVTELRWSA
jgi:hypothetical protein